ncbi:MAG TPA: serine/threonine-protein kinase [Vicinamibacterales bacterium]|nr:serine/threonine-protein kinase [Vicinamibacterales bacterium]
MSLAKGTRLGPYEILGKLGEGGMGEVFRAHDTRLGRTVALKLTAGPDSDDPQHRLRLEREARAIAALNHPHICAIHDVGREDGRDYLVMEYVEGETLEQRLERGPLPLAELLRAATEIASALDAAHRAGITHRDLKPANVMLTKGGVKLLDFGVARHRPIADGSGTDQLTTVQATIEGALVGTVPYMAPEQLEGRPVDGRTDIFAFGAVLFEMATGQRAFAGTSAAGLAAAILGESRPRLPEAAGLPPSLGRVISTCLARDPDERWQNAGDLLRALKWIGEDAGDARAAASIAPSRRWIVHAVWAAALAAAVAILWSVGPRRNLGPPPNPQPVIVLMDSPLPGRVYDPRTAAAGGTNADDVTDILRGLPVGIRKENTSPVWHREEQVIAENPDLIISHLSCLFDQRVSSDKEVYEHLFDMAQNRLLVFFAYVAAANPRTRFIVYSRGRIVQAGGEAAWVANWEGRLPALRGRLHAFSMPGGDMATFRDPATGELLKNRVIEVLRLGTR